MAAAAHLDPNAGRPHDPNTLDIGWADHFWEEYKYHHERWWSTFYQAMWIIGILGVTPWIPWIKENYPILSNFRARVAYGSSLLLFFGLLVWFLTLQFHRSRCAEHQLGISRGRGTGNDLPTKLAAFKEEGTWWKSYLFVASMFVIWIVWFYFLLSRY